jgi:hypothetical protein
MLDPFRVQLRQANREPFWFGYKMLILVVGIAFAKVEKTARKVVPTNLASTMQLAAGKRARRRGS